MDLAAPTDQVFPVVSDLDSYQHWLGFISRCEPANAESGDPGPAWTVTLRARLGPFARSKQLRMVRSECSPSSLVKFERREVDGREHSPWALESTLDATTATQTQLKMVLSYDGPLWSPILEKALDQYADEAKANLRRLVESD